MYKLDDISIYGLLTFDPHSTALLQEYQIKDYGGLKRIISSGNKDFQSLYWINKLMEAYKALKKLNEQDRKLPIYTSSCYQFNNLNPKVLHSYEANINASILPITSPLNISRTTNDRINEYSINDIRAMIERVTLSGKNGLEIISSFGTSKILKVFEALKFFEEQMVRLATTTDYENYKGNLFYKDYELKRSLIVKDIENILITLFNISSAFIWGELSDTSKENMFNSVLNPTTKRDRLIKAKLLDYLCNYMIIEDLESSVTLKRALTRFT